MPESGRQYLEQMCLIRFFEERVQQLIARGEVRGTCHLAVGQEAAAVGAVSCLQRKDLIVSTHRGHGHLLARGGDLYRMLAEIMGRQTGYCLGRGGTQHLCARKLGFLGTNGITGGGLPLAVGAALAGQLRHSRQVVLACLGDGAANQGTFHECLNLASIWRLPLVFFCENNGYAMSMPVGRAMASDGVAPRAAAYRKKAGLKSALWSAAVDGMDVFAVRQTVAKAVRRARRGDGPSLVEALTYRFLGHSKSDALVYRAREEEAAWRGRDPILLLRRRLEAAGETGLDELEQGARAAVEAALDRARGDPAGGAAVAREGVYA